MRLFIVYLFLAISLPTYSQTGIPKGTNAIKVIGVTFKEVGTKVLEAGYSIDKIDSNFQTFRTEWKYLSRYFLSIRLDIWLKDSTAIIKGVWGDKNFPVDIEYKKAKGNKLTFGYIKRLAESFNKPVEYIVTK